MRKNIITSSSENITSFLRNITPHFTGKEKIITLVSIIIMLSFVNITLCFPNSSDTSALSYSTDVNIGFTFNPTISLSISPDNLTISNLTPGTAAESNTITVNVATNTAYGYHLTANVGSNTTNYNTTNLVHASSSIATPASNATFTSLAYGSSVANKDNLSPNIWGYSYSKDNGTIWQPYSGLPLYSDTNHSTELISTYEPADSKSIDFKIAANANNAQPSGEYTNIINFYAVANSGPPLLYDLVEDMTKGTLAQNNVNLSDSIAQANSGVYTYDPTVYGTASDASNDYNIYFYRGILDTNEGLGTYGSDGKADAWPNYVKLSNDTCWRIVRTTGSGGVKMIYNGNYKNGMCANTAANTQVAAKAFNANNNVDRRSIIAVGYTFNGNYKTTTEDTAYGTLFGTDESYFGNSIDSTIKDYLENTWFVSTMSDYEDKLESSAGYCNDRSIYDQSGILLTNDSDIVAPYAISGDDFALYYFGSYYSGNASLNCLRNIADLYALNGASNGNGQLFKPVALLTAKEANLAGSGGRLSSGSYNSNSYLNSGSNFWLLTPFFRYYGNGSSYGFSMDPNGSLDDNLTSSSLGVRPVVSLMHHIQVMSGNGTATSPWTISE